MKYVSITFDDGRSDNFAYAFPIMQKYSLQGTLFCTTGYIDKTWPKPQSWLSSESPISIEELKKLDMAGWEIGLHGDQHILALSDFKVSLEKFDQWGLLRKQIGVSVPNSIVNKQELEKIRTDDSGRSIQYFRLGRRRNTKSLQSKMLFFLYTYMNLQWAYDRFNNVNLNYLSHIDTTSIYSVVIRHKDPAEMVCKFITQMPENTWIVLMLHSILPEKSEFYGCDPWNWSETQFEKLCKFVRALQINGTLIAKPVNEILDLQKEKSP